MTTTYHHSAFNDLAALLTGQLFPQAADYEQVRQLWNGEDTTRCDLALSVQDVIHTVRWTHGGLPLSVRAGGRSAGRALSEAW